MKGNPFVGMNYKDDGGTVISGDNHRRLGKAIAVHRRNHWFLVQFARGYREGFKYTPMVAPEPERKSTRYIGLGKEKY